MLIFIIVKSKVWYSHAHTHTLFGTWKPIWKAKQWFSWCVTECKKEMCNDHFFNRYMSSYYERARMAPTPLAGDITNFFLAYWQVELTKRLRETSFTEKKVILRQHLPITLLSHCFISFILSVTRSYTHVDW